MNPDAATLVIEIAVLEFAVPALDVEVEVEPELLVLMLLVEVEVVVLVVLLLLLSVSMVKKVPPMEEASPNCERNLVSCGKGEWCVQIIVYDHV
jgi:hypothetical protein